MPPAMWNDFQGFTNTDKLKYLLSGFNSDYLPEWHDIYLCVSKFIHELFTDRARRYKELNHYSTEDEE